MPLDQGVEMRCVDTARGTPGGSSQERIAPVPTEREQYVLEKNLPVYRVLYRRNRSPLPDPEALESRWQELDNPAETVFTDV